MVHLLYHRKTFRTGRLLGAAMGLSCSKLVPDSFTTLVRWGSAVELYRDSGKDVLNPGRAICLASNKLRALEAMKGAGLSIPDFTQATPHAAAGEVWLGRDLSGFGGKDIVAYQGSNTALCGGAHQWYSCFIPNEREYRLHVVGDAVVRTQRKYLERPEQRASEYIKNHSNGYVFKAPQKELNQDRKQLAVDAVKALGLDFGAVDLIIDYSGKAYVLEVNTAPGCSPLTLSAYATALGKLLEERAT